MNNLAKAIERMKRTRREQFRAELKRQKRMKGYVVKDDSTIKNDNK